MANKATPELAIVLDRPRKLKWDLNAMVAFEEATGVCLFQREQIRLEAAKRAAKSGKPIPADIFETMKGIRAALWACLLHEDPTLTLEQVGATIHRDNLGAISSALATAWGLAMPEDDGSPPGESRPTG